MLAELDQHLPFGYGVAFLDEDGADGRGVGGVDRGLHLHGFENDELLILGNLLADRDDDLEDQSGHRAGDREAYGRRGCGGSSGWRCSDRGGCGGY